MKEDVIGNRYGKLVVVEEMPPVYSVSATRKRSNRVVKCLCDCGSVKDIYLANLRQGKTESCGCINRTHGMSSTAEYKVWAGMKGRCHNPNHVDYQAYGAIGVTVCQEWRESFEQFLADMGRRPTDNHTIERIDVYNGYEPDNCIWLEKDKQAANKREERRKHGTHPQYEYRKEARERKTRGEYRVGGRTGGKCVEPVVEE